MSIAPGVPVPADFGQARDAVNRHLGQVLAGRTLELAGWERPDPDLVRSHAGLHHGHDRGRLRVRPGRGPGRGRGVRRRPAGDDYLLRLYFSHYPAWPPSARFVNPATRQFAAGDARWLPAITGVSELHVHANYAGTSGQVICCSATLEFYLVNHQVADQHRWQPGSSFPATLNVLSRYMRPPAYTGRQAS